MRYDITQINIFASNRKIGLSFCALYIAVVNLHNLTPVNLLHGDSKELRNAFKVYVIRICCIQRNFNKCKENKNSFKGDL